MSVNALEKALWKIYLQPSEAESYRADPQAYAKQFRLDEKELSDLASLDVMGMQDRGANPLLVLMAFQTVRGPERLQDYFDIVNPVNP